MKMNDVTKEQVNEWSDEEVVMWFNEFGKQDQAGKMREHILNEIEIRDAQGGSRILPIRVDSKVIE